MGTEKGTLRYIWYDYRFEVVFALVLSALLIASAWLSHLIPVEIFDWFINPALSIALAAICFFGGGLCLRHHEGIRVRKEWGTMLIAWGIWEVAAVIATKTKLPSIMAAGTDSLSMAAMVIGCVFAWMLFVYPTEVLRPGWLNWSRVLLQLSPLLVLSALDYFMPFDLRWLIALYPIGLLVMLIRHIRKYRLWCEDNFSTLDDIDVQWIVRYIMMLMLSGLVFYWLCISSLPTRAFTQQWFLAFILAYTTERVLYRPDPWKQLRSTLSQEEEMTETEQPYATYKETIEAWLDKEKPYLNPDFQLTDLRRVVPLNRTYLSQLINTEYGCSFYQWVNGLRIHEAKRMKLEHPEWTIQEISQRCGFSSRQVFTRSFLRETGITPSEWYAAQSGAQ